MGFDGYGLDNLGRGHVLTWPFVIAACQRRSFNDVAMSSTDRVTPPPSAVQSRDSHKCSSTVRPRCALYDFAASNKKLACQFFISRLVVLPTAVNRLMLLMLVLMVTMMN